VLLTRGDHNPVLSRDGDGAVCDRSERFASPQAFGSMLPTRLTAAIVSPSRCSWVWMHSRGKRGSKTSYGHPKQIHLSGFSHRTPENLTKSVSAVWTTARNSTASAARCASVVKFPPLPSARRKLKSNSGCRGPGLTTLTIRRSNQDSTCAVARATGIGLANTRELVHRRMKPSATTHGMPTGAVVPNKMSSRRSDRK
jgi:hypothetical protein